MKQIKIHNIHLPVFCCGIEGRAIHVKEVHSDCDMAQGDAECGNCDVGFYLVFPRSMAGDLQYSHHGISGDLPGVICPNPACQTKGWIIVNETL